MWSLIDDLDNLIERGLRVPASGKVLVDISAVDGIIDQMRRTVPDEIRMGQRIAAERERILADAHAQAKRMIEEAQAQVASQLDEQSIVQAARQRAVAVEETAHKHAASLKADAERYAAGQLAALEERLLRVLREVQGGQRTLRPTAENPSEKSGNRS